MCLEIHEKTVRGASVIINCIKDELHSADFNIYSLYRKLGRVSVMIRDISSLTLLRGFISQIPNPGILSDKMLVLRSVEWLHRSWSRRAQCEKNKKKRIKIRLFFLHSPSPTKQMFTKSPNQYISHRQFIASCSLFLRIYFILWKKGSRGIGF